ncbi:MAG: hypothetical protein OHK0039_33170 [Bacteroidia bacterium]
MRQGLTLLLLACLPIWGQEAGMEQVRQWLHKQGKAQGFLPGDLDALEISSAYETAHNGARHLYFQQYHQGLPVYEAVGAAHFHADGRLLVVHQSLQRDLVGRAPQVAPLLDAAQAVQAAAGQLGIATDGPLRVRETVGGARQAVTFDRGTWAAEDVPVALAYATAPDGSLRLAWELTIYTPDGQHWWQCHIDAADGNLLHRHDLVVHCNWSHSESLLDCEEAGHLHEAAPTGQTSTLTADGSAYGVYPLPLESPNHGPRALLSEPADSVASPFGWHDTDGQPGAEFTITRGNNVLAQEDRNGDNGSGYSPDGGSNLLFDFPIDFTQPPATFEDAAITNLFYWNNVMHDFWYSYGFDEAAGNFQQNNYGRGGQGGDYVFADAQDGSGTNNANFATPQDGQNPRMQMFIWTSGSALLDYLTINSPASIAGPYGAAAAGFGPGLPATPLTADLVLVEDGSGNNEGCNTITNSAALAGKIAVVDRGNCTFVAKITNVQNAGAAAVIVVNNQNSAPFAMGGNGTGINVPSVMISLQNGNAIKGALASGTVNGTLSDTGGGIPGFDSGLDNGVIVHEYTHGISNRLTGGPANAGCLGNEEQAGEGWSDWFGLVMTVRPGDQAATARGIGTYVSGEPVTGGGIRPFPYSTDMGINPVTYDYVKFLSVPHGVGSVMCSMLWDLYWELVDEYGFDNDLQNGSGGNNIALQLVVDGLKLQPCGPGFVDVRDAILLADELNNGGANKCLIWRVFARRGLGYSALQGSPASRADGTQAFDLPPDCQPILLLDKTADPAQTVRVGDTITYTLKLTNFTEVVLTGISVLDTLPQGIAYVPGSSGCAVTEANGILSFDIGSMNPGQVLSCDFKAYVSDTSYTRLLFNDDIEDSTAFYLFSSGTGGDKWRVSGQRPRSGVRSLFVPNVGALNDQSVMLSGFIPDSATTLVFWHAYNTEEEWDGGFVEILPTNAGVWTDLAPYIVENSYNSVVGTNNPLGTRAVFGGNSKGYVRTVADLSDFAGEDVFLRFRFVSDDNTFAEGWYVDDVALVSGEEVSRSNSACASSKEGFAWCDAQPFAHQILQGVPAVVDTTRDTSSTRIDIPGWAQDIRIYPNPARDRLHVQLAQATPGAMRLRLTDLSGRLLAQLTWPAAQTGEACTLALPPLAAGLYLLDVWTPSGSYRHKVQIE